MRVEGAPVLTGLAALAFSLAMAAGACTGNQETSVSPNVRRCESFRALERECYARVDEGTPPEDPLSCEDSESYQPLYVAEADCALASRDAYCLSMKPGGSLTRDEKISVAKVLACSKSKVSPSPCKEAHLLLADCGYLLTVRNDCVEDRKVWAECILEDTASACAAYDSQTPEGLKNPEAAAYHACVAARWPPPDAGR